VTDAGLDTSLTITPAAPEALLAVEIWDAVEAVAADLSPLTGPLPSPCHAAGPDDLRVLWWEPQTWLIRAPLARRDALIIALTAALAGRGAVTDLSAGFKRIRLTGPRARDLLMIGAVFDAEHSLPTGALVGTVIHHLPVRLDAVEAEIIDAYMLPSYANDLLHHWRKAWGRMALGY
jgi:heterotetrameric sarcosine oxidase gamma subunit